MNTYRLISMGLMLVLMTLTTISHSQSTQITLPQAPPSRVVLGVDMDISGLLSVSDLREARDAFLVIKTNAQNSGTDLKNTFQDQEGNTYRFLNHFSDLMQLDKNNDQQLDARDAEFNAIRLAYVLLSGRLQTVPLSDAGIVIIRVEKIPSSVKEFINAYVIRGNGGVNKIELIEVMD